MWTIAESPCIHPWSKVHGASSQSQAQQADKAWCYYTNEAAARRPQVSTMKAWSTKSSSPRHHCQWVGQWNRCHAARTMLPIKEANTHGSGTAGDTWSVLLKCNDSDTREGLPNSIMKHRLSMTTTNYLAKSAILRRPKQFIAQRCWYWTSS